MIHSVLLVEDTPEQAALYSAYLATENYRVTAVASGEAALEAVAQQRPAVVLLDLQLPGIQGLDVLAVLAAQKSAPPVIVITDDSSSETVAEAMGLGAADFLAKPFGRRRLHVTVANAIRRNELSVMVDSMRAHLGRERFHGFIGASLPMQAVYRIIESAAPSRATVFITGESGTGKELCAAAIHAESPRRDKPFIAVNCAALPRELMESEIFGHVKGAFTGALRSRDGAALLADGGTLFLDEIGEMDLDLQSKLLRFVQSGQVQRVGSSQTVQVDVRILCATNRDPASMVREGRFREDLFYRLHVIPVHLPPLRERGDDLLAIARQFLSRFAQEENKSLSRFTADAERFLLEHRWPGNVRELENAIRNAAVLNDGPDVTVPMLKGALFRPGVPMPPSMAPRGEAVPSAADPSSSAHAAANMPVASRRAPATILPLSEVERIAIEAAIAHFNGNVLQAAAALQVSSATIYRRLQEWKANALEAAS